LSPECLEFAFEQIADELYSLKWLRAPVSGLVQKVDATTVGQVVTPAQSLVTIVPDGTPLIVEATVSNEDIGYLKVGQPVEVKVDTFPFQRYGSLKGTLTSISPDAEDKNAASRDTDTRAGAGSQQSDPSRDPANNSPNAGYVYKVHIRTEDSHFVVDGEAYVVVWSGDINCSNGSGTYTMNFLLVEKRDTSAAQIVGLGKITGAASVERIVGTTSDSLTIDVYTWAPDDARCCASRYERWTLHLEPAVQAGRYTLKKIDSKAAKPFPLRPGETRLPTAR
jgi:hypothetical protein